MFSLGDLTRLMATYELPEIETPDDSVFGSLRFVVQILRLPNDIYIPRVLRKERIHVVPAYYEKREQLVDVATVEITVPDDACDWESFECASEAEALQRALDELQQLLGR